MAINLNRRGFIGAAAAAAVAAPTLANAKEKTSDKLTDNPAAKGSSAQFDHSVAAHDLELTGTFNLGKSTIDTGEVITAARWGIFRAHVQGGKLTHLTPFEHDYAPTPNISGLAQLPYTSSRIRYPMVREGYLKNGPKSREGRGSEKFVRVSWDKALDLVASEMKRVYGEYGPSAVFGRSYG